MVASQPEKPASAENVADAPVPTAKIERVDLAAGSERLTYTHATPEAEISTHTEVELEESMSINEAEEEPASLSMQSDEQEEKDDPPDESEPDDQDSNGVPGLLDDILDLDDEKHNDKEKGKGHKDG
jgi:hypothetical protein